MKLVDNFTAFLNYSSVKTYLSSSSSSSVRNIASLILESGLPTKNCPESLLLKASSILFNRFVDAKIIKLGTSFIPWLK